MSRKSRRHWRTCLVLASVRRSYREWTETDTVVDDEAWDSLPSLADVAIEGEGYRPTETAIQRLWDATEDHEIAIDPIEPLTVEPPEKLTDSKRFRRPAIIAVAAVVALGAWIVREVAEQPARAADAREMRYDPGCERDSFGHHTS